MSDVIHKIDSSKEIINGTITHRVNQNGTVIRDTKDEKSRGTQSQINKLDTRFDDTNYYSN